MINFLAAAKIILKSIFPLIVAVGLLLFGRWFDKRKEQKKQRLKLFNFTQHLFKLLERSADIHRVFSEYSQKIIADPLGGHMLEDRLSIPDIKRALEMNKDDIFSAFISKYDNKVEAATDYRRAYNLLEMYRQLFVDILNGKYDELSTETYKDLKTLREGIFLVDTTAMEVERWLKTIPAHKDLEDYKALTKVHSAYKEKEKNTELTLKFAYTELFLPLKNAIENCKERKPVFDLYILTARYIHLYGYIEHDIKQLGKLLDGNLESLKNVIDELRPIAEKLKGKLPEFYEPKENLEAIISDRFDI